MMMMRLKTSFNQSLYMFLQRRLLTTLVVAAMFLLFSYIFKKKLLKYEKFRNLDNSACLHYRPKTHLFALLSKFLNFSYFSYAIMCYENRKFYAKKLHAVYLKWYTFIFIYCLIMLDTCAVYPYIACSMGQWYWLQTVSRPALYCIRRLVDWSNMAKVVRPLAS